MSSFYNPTTGQFQHSQPQQYVWASTPSTSPLEPPKLYLLPVTPIATQQQVTYLQPTYQPPAYTYSPPQPTEQAQPPVPPALLTPVYKPAQPSPSKLNANAKTFTITPPPPKPALFSPKDLHLNTSQQAKLQKLFEKTHVITPCYIENSESYNKDALNMLKMDSGNTLLWNQHVTTITKQNKSYRCTTLLPRYSTANLSFSVLELKNFLKDECCLDPTVYLVGSAVEHLIAETPRETLEFGFIAQQLAPNQFEYVLKKFVQKKLKEMSIELDEKTRNEIIQRCYLTHFRVSHISSGCSLKIDGLRITFVALNSPNPQWRGQYFPQASWFVEYGNTSQYAFQYYHGGAHVQHEIGLAKLKDRTISISNAANAPVSYLMKRLCQGYNILENQAAIKSELSQYFNPEAQARIQAYYGNDLLTQLANRLTSQYPPDNNLTQLLRQHQSDFLSPQTVPADAPNVAAPSEKPAQTLTQRLEKFLAKAGDGGSHDKRRKAIAKKLLNRHKDTTTKLTTPEKCQYALNEFVLKSNDVGQMVDYLNWFTLFLHAASGTKYMQKLASDIQFNHLENFAKLIEQFPIDAKDLLNIVKGLILFTVLDKQPGKTLVNNVYIAIQHPQGTHHLILDCDPLTTIKEFVRSYHTLAQKYSAIQNEEQAQPRIADLSSPQKRRTFPFDRFKNLPHDVNVTVPSGSLDEKSFQTILQSIITVIPHNFQDNPTAVFELFQEISNHPQVISPQILKCAALQWKLKHYFPQNNFRELVVGALGNPEELNDSYFEKLSAAMPTEYSSQLIPLPYVVNDALDLILQKGINNPKISLTKIQNIILESLRLNLIKASKAQILIDNLIDAQKTHTNRSKISLVDLFNSIPTNTLSSLLSSFLNFALANNDKLLKIKIAKHAIASDKIIHNLNLFELARDIISWSSTSETELRTQRNAAIQLYVTIANRSKNEEQAKQILLELAGLLIENIGSCTLTQTKQLLTLYLTPLTQLEYIKKQHPTAHSDLVKICENTISKQTLPSILKKLISALGVINEGSAIKLLSNPKFLEKLNESDREYLALPFFAQLLQDTQDNTAIQDAFNLWRVARRSFKPKSARAFLQLLFVTSKLLSSYCTLSPQNLRSHSEAGKTTKESLKLMDKARKELSANVQSIVNELKQIITANKSHIKSLALKGLHPFIEQIKLAPTPLAEQLINTLLASATQLDLLTNEAAETLKLSITKKRDLQTHEQLQDRINTLNYTPNLNPSANAELISEIYGLMADCLNKNEHYFLVLNNLLSVAQHSVPSWNESTLTIVKKVFYDIPSNELKKTETEQLTQFLKLFVEQDCIKHFTHQELFYLLVALEDINGNDSLRLILWNGIYEKMPRENFYEFCKNNILHQKIFTLIQHTFVQAKDTILLELILDQLYSQIKPKELHDPIPFAWILQHVLKTNFLETCLKNKCEQTNKLYLTTILMIARTSRTEFNNHIMLSGIPYVHYLNSLWNQIKTRLSKDEQNKIISCAFTTYIDSGTENDIHAALELATNHKKSLSFLYIHALLMSLQKHLHLTYNTQKPITFSDELLTKMSSHIATGLKASGEKISQNQLNELVTTLHNIMCTSIAKTYLFLNDVLRAFFKNTHKYPVLKTNTQLHELIIYTTLYLASKGDERIHSLRDAVDQYYQASYPQVVSKITGSLKIFAKDLNVFPVNELIVLHVFDPDFSKQVLKETLVKLTAMKQLNPWYSALVYVTSLYSKPNNFSIQEATDIETSIINGIIDSLGNPQPSSNNNKITIRPADYLKVLFPRLKTFLDLFQGYSKKILDCSIKVLQAHFMLRSSDPNIDINVAIKSFVTILSRPDFNKIELLDFIIQALHITLYPMIAWYIDKEKKVADYILKHKGTIYTQQKLTALTNAACEDLKNYVFYEVSEEYFIQSAAYSKVLIDDIFNVLTDTKNPNAKFFQEHLKDLQARKQELCQVLNLGWQGCLKYSAFDV